MRSCLSSELRRHRRLECNLRVAASRYCGCSTTAIQYTGLTFRTSLPVFVCCKDLATNSINCLYPITGTGLFIERCDLNFVHDSGCSVHAMESRVRFVVEKVASGQILLRVLRFPLPVSFHQCSILLLIYMLLKPEG